MRLECIGAIGLGNAVNRADPAQLPLKGARLFLENRKMQTEVLIKNVLRRTEVGM